MWSNMVYSLAILYMHMYVLSVCRGFMKAATKAKLTGCVQDDFD